MSIFFRPQYLGVNEATESITILSGVVEWICLILFVYFVVKISLGSTSSDNNNDNERFAKEPTQGIENQSVRPSENKAIDFDETNNSCATDDLLKVGIKSSAHIESYNVDGKDRATSEFISKATPEKIGSIFAGLLKTRDILGNALNSLFKNREPLEDELVEMLIANDFGPSLSMELAERIIEDSEYKVSLNKEEAVKTIFKRYIREILNAEPDCSIISALHQEVVQYKENRPFVIMLVGVNGVGKTTTCAKIAELVSRQSIKCLIIAGDTFRAAAVEQLQVWGQRLNVKVFSVEGEKPSSVAYKGIQEAIVEKYDLVIVDTAGRLHNRSELMDELKSINIAIEKSFHSRGITSKGPDECYLVVDGTTGQNAVVQAEKFNSVTELTGIIVTKLDGTTKGGIIVPLSKTVGKPIVAVGVGEKSLDLIPFHPEEYVQSLL